MPAGLQALAPQLDVPIFHRQIRPLHGINPIRDISPLHEFGHFPAPNQQPADLAAVTPQPSAPPSHPWR